MTNEEEIDTINNLIIRRQKALDSGNESEVEDIEKLFEKKGFEINDTTDTTLVKRKKIKESI